MMHPQREAERAEERANRLEEAESRANRLSEELDKANVQIKALELALNEARCREEEYARICELWEMRHRR